MTEATDQLFLGRQPILDREQRLYAYELLFRNGKGNHAEVSDGVQATATVIANAFSEFGIEAALGSCRGFINVDEEFLFSDVVELLPRDSVVLEILETVPPTPAVVERCEALRACGYTLALDDVIQLQPEFAPLLKLVDIIKIDIQPLNARQIEFLAKKLHPTGKTLLAEKVDSREQMEACLELGFSLFQGYYFAKPTIIAGKKMDHSHLSLMKLMGLVLSDAENRDLENALKAEPGLTVNLLRLTNSVGSGVIETITSLNHAITILGRRQLLRWLQLLAFTANRNGSHHPNPLMILAATRGRLMELLAAEVRPHDHAFADKAFMVGIMSLMPALVGQPIEEIIAPLGLASDVRDALCGSEGELHTLLQVTEVSENGDLERMNALLDDLHHCLRPRALNRAQTEALIWANQINQERPKTGGHP